MADIFISYKREELARAQQVAQALQEEGYTTFHDVGADGIHPGESWDSRLETELAAAKCCVVLWSVQSVASDNVRSEARRANERSILAPALIVPCRAPLGLDLLQAADLIRWSGDRRDPQWRFLVDRGVGVKVGRAALGAGLADAPPGAETAASAALPMAGSGPRRFALIAGALALSLIAAGGGFWFAFRQAIAPIAPTEKAAAPLSQAPLVSRQEAPVAPPLDEVTKSKDVAEATEQARQPATEPKPAKSPALSPPTKAPPETPAPARAEPKTALSSITLPTAPITAPAPTSAPAQTRKLNSGDLEALPTAEDLARFYPARAMEREQTGRVRMRCKVLATHQLSCRVESEEPLDWGFGQASLALCSTLRAKAKFADGQSTIGAEYRLILDWKLG